MIRQAALVRFSAAAVTLGALSGSASIAQQQQAKAPQFEVATIKPGSPREGSSSSTKLSGDQFRMVNVPLRQWIELALSIRDYALKAPSWLETSRFDLNAKLPDNTPVDNKAVAEMMKELLIERFGLKWHEVSLSVDGYELTTDKKVLIKPSGLLERLHGNGAGSGPSFINGHNMPLSELAKSLEGVLGRPVVDATHLSGVFDYKLIWRPSDDAMAAEEKRHGIDIDNLPASVGTALREQLGLRLQSAKVPARVIVLDYINRQPTEN